MRNNQKGFTLLELVLVIILVGVLAAAAVARYISLAKEAERAVVEYTIGILLRSPQHLFYKPTDKQSADHSAEPISLA